MRNMVKSFYVTVLSKHSINGIIKQELCKEGKRVKKHYPNLKDYGQKSKALVGSLLLQVT